jgi:hypothetical protein
MGSMRLLKGAAESRILVISARCARLREWHQT